MNKFNIGQVYEHTGKTYKIISRTEKTIKVECNGLTTSSHRIKLNHEGYEMVEVDSGYRTIIAIR